MLSKRRWMGPALACALVGCTHTRYVTDWLRTSRTRPFCVMAESGSHGACNPRTRAERRVGGRWTELPDVGDLAFAFAGDTRAVVGERLLREEGRAVALECRGDLRAVPRGDELVCVDTFARYTSRGEPQTVRVVRMDRDGRELARRQVSVPVRVPDAEPPMGLDVDTWFVGFHRDGLVFRVHASMPGDSYASDSPHRCRAFVLRADDTWRELGSMTVRMGEFYRCNFPRFWNDVHGWDIERGAVPQDTDGEPDP